MAEIVMTDYLAMLERSRLFDSSAKLETCYKEWQALDDTIDAENSQAFANWLIQNGYITQWQSDNIFAGKYKGFFLGKYKLLRSIGAGGMSSVYLAVHTILERQVAIKVLPKSRVTSDSSYLERFLLEAQAVASLDHPNIVRAYDVDTEGNSIYYLVMEYIDGPDLLSLVKKNGPLNIFRAAQFIRQAAQGLQHAHSAGLIHRDMKPANLLVDSDDNVHVLDLGLARFTDEKRSSLTLAYDENVLGTADYLAPEQARNSHNVDARADIYGLGCTLYYLLVGHVPFPDGTLAQRIQAHQTRMPMRIQDERRDVPDDLAEICWKMMAKDPNDRQATAQEVADDLTRWLLEHGQKVEGFTGSLAELQRKKEETGEKLQSELQHDAQNELNSLAGIASLANLGAVATSAKKGDSATGVNAPGRKNTREKQAPAGDGMKRTFFSAFEKVRQMVSPENNTKKKPVRGGTSTATSGGSGTSAKAPSNTSPVANSFTFGFDDDVTTAKATTSDRTAQGDTGNLFSFSLGAEGKTVKETLPSETTAVASSDIDTTVINLEKPVSGGPGSSTRKSGSGSGNRVVCKRVETVSDKKAVGSLCVIVDDTETNNTSSHSDSSMQSNVLDFSSNLDKKSASSLSGRSAAKSGSNLKKNQQGTKSDWGGILRSIFSSFSQKPRKK